MIFTWRAEIVQWAVIAAMFVGAAVAWPLVPERIPIHWNLQGQVDGYGGRFVGLLLLPIFALGLYALLLFLPRLDPGRANYKSCAGTYNLIRVAVVVFMAALYAVTVAAALGAAVDVGMVVSLGVGALFVVLGNVMGKIRPNWFVGIRTPWTLSSKLSWSKTHRLGGWVFIVLGPLVAAAGILRQPWFFMGTMAVGGLSLAWLVIYSYLVYRTDPDRTTPAGTSPTD
jgi:immunity protein, SdpI family